jgi:hypothetical protein
VRLTLLKPENKLNRKSKGEARGAQVAFLAYYTNKYSLVIETKLAYIKDRVSLLLKH